MFLKYYCYLLYNHHYASFDSESSGVQYFYSAYSSNFAGVPFIIPHSFNLRVPASRFFTTLYPKPIVLSAGTSYTLPITFRPLEKVLYEDAVEFSTKVRLLVAFSGA